MEKEEKGNIGMMGVLQGQRPGWGIQSPLPPHSPENEPNKHEEKPESQALRGFSRFCEGQRILPAQSQATVSSRPV